MNLEIGTFQQLQKRVALFLIECAQFEIMFLLQKEIGQGILRWRIDRKHIELMHFSELFHQFFRCQHMPDFPTCVVVGFPEGTHHNGTLRQLRETRHALVFHAIENDVFVHLIAEDDDVGSIGQLLEFEHIGCVHHAARRVVWRVDDDHSRTLIDQLLHFFPIDQLTRQVHLNVHGLSAMQLNGRVVAIVRWFKNDDLITFIHERGNGGVNGLCGASRDVDLRFRIILGRVEFFYFFGQPLAQNGCALHGRILIEPLLHVRMGQVNQSFRNGKIRKAL